MTEHSTGLAGGDRPGRSGRPVTPRPRWLRRDAPVRRSDGMIAATPFLPRIVSPASVAAIAARYETIPYAALPHPLTHPDHLAAVATLFGHDAAPPQHCRVLEVGCSDGANLLPMAASLPEAGFVGCDVAPAAIAAAAAAAEGAGLRNVTLRCEDLASLDASLGPFDYIVAHGVYSWVPASVRDALFALAQARLAPGGVMYVSYNVLPGCRVRQAAWEMVRRQVDGIDDPRARLHAARSFARLLADGARSQYPGEEAVRAELRSIAQRSDSELFHDDFALVNDPVYFRDFVGHAQRHVLAFLAEADIHSMTAAGLAPGARQWLATLDPLGREEQLDLLRLRRFRRTLLRRAGDVPAGPAFAPERLSRLRVGADASLEKAADAGQVADLAAQLDPAAPQAVRELFEHLLAQAPATMPAGAARARLAAARPPVGDADAVLRDACVSGLLGVHAGSVELARTPGPFPLASPLARWQARGQDTVTNLRHVPVRLPEGLRALLALLDGSRDRAALAAALAVPAGAGDADARVERMLDELGRTAFLRA